MKNAVKRIFTCIDRRRYSRKRTKFCRNLKFCQKLATPTRGVDEGLDVVDDARALDVLVGLDGHDEVRRLDVVVVAGPVQRSGLHLGADFRKCENENTRLSTKNKPKIEMQKATKISKYSADFETLSGKTLEGWLSAVSKPIFATKINWKALAEFYTMHSVVQLLNLKHFVKICRTFA